MNQLRRYGSILILISINSVAVDSFLKSTDGYIRFGYQKDDSTHTDLSLGGKLHFESASWSNTSVGASFYTTNQAGKHEGAGVPFFDAGNHSYTLLGELYLQGTWNNTTLKIGRQELDTPFADTDDIGMIPNTFEALFLTNSDIAETTLFIAQLQKWSGVDSDNPKRFNRLNGDKGVQMVGVRYEGISKTTLSGWFYNTEEHVKTYYLDAVYEQEREQFSYAVAGQYILQDYDNGDSSTIYGLAASLGHSSSGLTASIAYNKVHGTAADNLYGGGPYFTNAEHHTLTEAGKDGDSILYGLEWDASSINIKGVMFGVNIDKHSNGSLHDSSEYDLVASYAYSEKLNMSAVYSNIDDDIEPFTNLRIFLNYLF